VRTYTFYRIISCVTGHSDHVHFSSSVLRIVSLDSTEYLVGCDSRCLRELWHWQRECWPDSYAGRWDCNWFV